MELHDRLMLSLLAILLIVGGYQFYFLPQRKPLRQAIYFPATIDNFIPFWPSWVYIYSLLYYPFIIGTVFTIDTYEKFYYISFNFLILLAIQVLIFYLFPVKILDEWRNFDKNRSLSTRFLAFVHKFDGESNCFPSMHVSVATLVALHMTQNLTLSGFTPGYWLYLFPALIAISTLFTKQHYLIDLPAGFFLGWLVFQLY